jgi:formylglycine-generating enzyme required for sulfatase activity
LLNSDERTWPVASKKPNDWGIFDMHGNVWNWCQYGHGRPNEDLRVSSKDEFFVRGGSCITGGRHVHTGKRRSHVPTQRVWDIGFRPVRTINAE